MQLDPELSFLRLNVISIGNLGSLSSMRKFGENW